MDWGIENYPSQLFITQVGGSSKFYNKAGLVAYSVSGNILIDETILDVTTNIMTANPADIYLPAINGVDDLVKEINIYINTIGVIVPDTIPLDAIHIESFGQVTVPNSASQAYDVTDSNAGSFLYVPPTQARTHQIASSSVQDIGSVIESGTMDMSGGQTIIKDASATFQALSVAAGDIFLNDTTGNHSHVVSVTSETELVILPPHHTDLMVTGNTYRIVRATGTGCAVTHLENCILADGTLAEEFIVNNGTTNVPTTRPYARINKMHGHGVGSNGSNVGTITATADTDATVTATILAGNMHSQMLFFTIPLGYQGVLKKINITITVAGAASLATAGFRLMKRNWGPMTNSDDGLLNEGEYGCAVNNQLVLDFASNGNPTDGKILHQLSDFWVRNIHASTLNTICSGSMLIELNPIQQ